MVTSATRRDYEDFLLLAYFGDRYLGDPKAACVHRAYLDFNRTLHGVARFGEKQRIHEDAVSHIKSAISNLSGAGIINQGQFDEWHRSACMSLQDLYNRGEFPKFWVGHGQKWINMTLKYIFTFGEIRIPGFASLYGYCHVPLDNIIIGRLGCYGFPKLSRAWSRMDCYEEYLQRQIWIRQTFAILPLDLELFAWTKRDFDLTEYVKGNSSIGAST